MTDLASLLGDEADSLLTHESKGIPKDDLHLPGPDYIERALHDYKKGGRKNPIMSTFAGQIKDADVRVIAEYYSGREPSLHTEPRPSTILTAGSEH